MRYFKSINILLFVIVVLISACALDPVIYPVRTGINIKYQVVLNKKCNCNIAYADSLNYEVTTPLNQTTWEKSFRVLNKDYFKTAFFTVSSKAGTTQATGKANIYVNGVLKATADFTTEPNPRVPTVSFQVRK